MDEITELKRIWESTEQRLAALSGDQIRGYKLTKKSPVQIIKDYIEIPVNSDSSDIIDILTESEFLDSDNVYDTLESGEDQIIRIYMDSDEEHKTIMEFSTSDEIEDFDQFMEDVLDIERVQYLSGRDGWITKEYTIVLGTGGPHVEFTTGYSINVYWGGKSQEFTTYDDNARATIDRVEEYLNEIYQES